MPGLPLPGGGSTVDSGCNTSVSENAWVHAGSSCCCFTALKPLPPAALLYRSSSYSAAARRARQSSKRGGKSSMNAGCDHFGQYGPLSDCKGPWGVVPADHSAKCGEVLSASWTTATVDADDLLCPNTKLAERRKSLRCCCLRSPRPALSGNPTAGATSILCRKTGCGLKPGWRRPYTPSSFVCDFTCGILRCSDPGIPEPPPGVPQA
mmetsp:Transcript_93730/g.260944  ORF Transcript_93730/g.260944 Transcript_93730/m.260944 type:complete len:208 (+) Transcript_93730:519-1142(+)